jgi:hypothetical protein
MPMIVLQFFLALLFEMFYLVPPLDSPKIPNGGDVTGTVIIGPDE